MQRETTILAENRNPCLKISQLGDTLLSISANLIEKTMKFKEFWLVVPSQPRPTVPWNGPRRTRQT
jgi:hypothetical protein